MRKRLDEIIHMNGGNNWWKPELFSAKTLPLLPKDLEVLMTPPYDDENYNCFLYALGLGDDRNLVNETKGFLYDTFIRKLIDEGELVMTDSPKAGDYIFYRDLKNYPNMITHAGVIEGDGMVVSKWSWGPLFRHREFDVPESYGDDVSYARAISEERAKKLYEKYKDFNKEPKKVKTILVDAVDAFVIEGAGIFKEMHELLEMYQNKKIILTNADDRQFAEFGLDAMPYEVFTLKHNPEKTDPKYFIRFLEEHFLLPEDAVYFEHNEKAVESARSVGIDSYHYDSEKKDLAALKNFLDVNAS